MPTHLIINADDFGFSRRVTDGILESHLRGILTSTTLMTTMPDRDRAIDLAGQTSGLGVGIHLSLTQGAPLTACRRLLSKAHGTFYRSLPRLIWCLRKRAARQEAETELAAQIGYARARGLSPTHVDSHKHVCHLPSLHDAFIGACKAQGIRWVRTAREGRIPGMPSLSPSYRVLAHYARVLAVRAAEAELLTTDWFFGLATTGRTDVAAWRAIAAHAPPSLGEVMVHPGFSDDITAAETRLLGEREVEMKALCDADIREALRARGISLIHFGQAAEAIHQRQP
jgi:predicted glycoside hydrolase/deacetylase ChbG (UPF0249 family)